LAGDEWRRFPMSGAKSLALGRSSATPGHVGRSPGLLDEHQLLGVEIELAFKQCLAPLQGVRPVLLRGVRAFFA